MEKYKFNQKAFEIYDYDKVKTFSSFLPGLAGKKGIPLWAFYVNRGQVISSFGLRDKNGSIMEFYPANLAYMYVSTIGFRTFVKLDGKTFEIFDALNETPKRVMRITQSAVSIEETNLELQIRVKVTYFGLPNEDFAAMTRRVEITSLSENKRKIEVMDGITQILPSGVDYGGYKAISNLLRSWMNVENLENQVAFFKLRSSTGDEAETKVSKDGNFYLSFVDHQLTTPITDWDLVFDYDTLFKAPRYFERHSIEEINSQPQITENKVACGFTPLSKEINPNQTIQIDTLIGYTIDVETINRKVDYLSKPGYFDSKEIEAAKVIDVLLEDVTTKTSVPLFDEYIRQNYLDNLLRGGYPMTIPTKDKSFVYYLYSRKHGDLERDYNFFTIAPEFYSQGNGNFRDVCQNRRNDVLFHPEIGETNLFLFASLIQADGYNPLGINGSTFELKDKTVAGSLIKKYYGTEQPDLVSHIQGKFTPGSIINLAYHKHLDTAFSDDELLSDLLGHATQNIEASFGEGFWSDHWTYILDLAENYEHIFPDKMNSVLYDNMDYMYYNSPVSVYPRSEKTVVDGKGFVRQYGALRHPDKEKIAAFNMKEHGTNWLTFETGPVVKTNLFSKLFVLAYNKFTLLDPYGIGIEMEGNKPGWNDAMNGLPGLFGSGVSETLELLRLVRYLIKHIDQDKMIELPVALLNLVDQTQDVDSSDDFIYWNEIRTYTEAYREIIRKPIAKTRFMPANELKNALSSMESKLELAVQKAIQLGNGIVPTYLIYEATDFSKVIDSTGKEILSHYGMPKAKVHAFKVKALPYFLEAPARYLKVEKNPTITKALIEKVKKTDLYDEVLGMYKTSSDLEHWGYDIGRIRAFTKGWLERESNFLHMTYKYLLGILKSHHYEEFFIEAKTNLVYELNPEVYGRSTLENSSFIATSNNPNPHLYGQGFVSRLSGSTAEMISIWSLLMYGHDMYHLHNGVLSLKLKPLLPKEYFNHQKIETTFHQIKIVYMNHSGKDGWLLEPTSYLLKKNGSDDVLVKGNIIEGKLAEDIRNHQYQEIVITLE
ncbi:MAG: cellobiose phosphorylase [Firmicutes bacterium]|nr:cellobiose phosphorylase [Bacillota bacterium]